MIDIPSYPAPPLFDWLKEFGGTAYVQSDPDYVDLPAWQKAQADAIDTDFWKIIRASGVPYLPVPGNHDPPKLFRRLMTSLEFTGAPFFHAQEPSRKQENAIVFKTPTGKSFCALNLTEGIVFKATPGRGRLGDRQRRLRRRAPDDPDPTRRCVRSAAHDRHPQGRDASGRAHEGRSSSSRAGTGARRPRARSRA